MPETHSHWKVPTNPGDDGMAAPRLMTVVRNAISSGDTPMPSESATSHAANAQQPQPTAVNAITTTTSRRLTSAPVPCTSPLSCLPGRDLRSRSRTRVGASRCPPVCSRAIASAQHSSPPTTRAAKNTWRSHDRCGTNGKMTLNRATAPTTGSGSAPRRASATSPGCRPRTARNMKIRLSGTPTSNPIMMLRRNSRGPANAEPSCGAAGLLFGDSTGDTGERLYQRRCCDPAIRQDSERQAAQAVYRLRAVAPRHASAREPQHRRVADGSPEMFHQSLERLHPAVLISAARAEQVPVDGDHVCAVHGSQPHDVRQGVSVIRTDFGEHPRPGEAKDVLVVHLIQLL